ncbi:hypothetical protein [Deinococcus peraridilitoris]|uniref:Uncharacterized protein n=1 Tax=Deinococcus peraridilitoris (strain DSM 19664 / LMG 22246 / CIP 109416 / KR-200) TaxID=937777 RepID=K9ZZR4_DEIPD|nr:hypothetical protein [Deinococcus peraridilitoris]AFZ67108.1 hypothetical protein Deipe_1567 [Deinococcus peraridilitoris DSM 19664]
MHTARELPPMPARIAKLPVARGYPVPWFVQWFGLKPDFRVVDSRKVDKAVKENRCFVCGEKFLPGEPYAFVIGPMCAVNRVDAEPPVHHECGEWSIKACPFLSRPHMNRREDDMPEGTREAAGEMIKRNPGVTVLWLTMSYTIARVHNGRLFDLGEPISVAAFKEGRPATPEELRDSVLSGLPALRDAARSDGYTGLALLNMQLEVASRVLGVNLDNPVTAP